MRIITSPALVAAIAVLEAARRHLTEIKIQAAPEKALPGRAETQHRQPVSRLSPKTERRGRGQGGPQGGTTGRLPRVPRRAMRAIPARIEED